MAGSVRSTRSLAGEVLKTIVLELHLREKQ